MNSINNFLLEKQLSTISTTVPDRLDYLMRLHNLTNIALSEIMCCAESTISGYRTGRRVPDIFVICHLSTIFGVTPNYFLGFTDEICPTHNWLCDIYNAFRYHFITITGYWCKCHIKYIEKWWFKGNKKKEKTWMNLLDILNFLWYNEIRVWQRNALRCN